MLKSRKYRSLLKIRLKGRGEVQEMTGAGVCIFTPAHVLSVWLTRICMLYVVKNTSPVVCLY